MSAAAEIIMLSRGYGRSARDRTGTRPPVEGRRRGHVGPTGAGPGFCGVVTAFHLALHRRPVVCAAGVYVCPVEVVDEVFT
ncbi:hypothetical protein AB0D91_44995 [Streptomyces canus]|uniref:hypothetical protein n=1 Tax=Streptomyces canus TaxID=58343 RepID=UPI0034085C01